MSLTHRCNALPLKILSSFPEKNNKLIWKRIWKFKVPRIAKTFFFCILMDIIFRAVLAKWSRNLRELLYTALSPPTQSLLLAPPPAAGPTLMCHSHPKALVYVRVHSWHCTFCLDKYVTTSIHHCSRIQNGFTALKVLCAPPAHLSLPPTPDLSTVFAVLPFQNVI